ncbi:uncharacterized protein LOC123294746 [Chrysoperla carnea]|uniref:uncharacterized protein LOC123294746 n=1 Tax=Chrysoperla carnea TaxID=189513 RepID=UPI001D0835ED|nr:uncharacterized protein LOC123294746 [Chrysoperla carnea]
MGHQSCCVVDCKNTSRNSNCKFYKFPVGKWKLNQRKKWITAVKRQNIDGLLWSPKPMMDVICSEHFIGGEKSDVESSPNYAPISINTEFNIEILANVDHRVYCYSHYKKDFTAKVLIGITPAGFICLKSKVAGRRKSDSQMTIESGLLDLLEDGDIVLADKGFPEIKTVIDASGKKLKMVMPPFLEKKSEFTIQETQETYSIAKVRIHVERIMQRLRLYQVLNKFPENVFHCVDDIIHICCVLLLDIQ